jgi:LEA14-like dessication related protein
VITILLIALFTAIYLNVSASLQSGLAQSLDTFQLYSVSIVDETAIPSIDLNVSFIIKSLADFPITVKSIEIQMYINSETIGTATPTSKGLTFVILPEENITLYFIPPRIVNSEIIKDIKNPPYLFSANATITAYAQWFFVTESKTRPVSISQNMLS